MDDERGMTIAADFALIALNDEGKPYNPRILRIALAGAMIVDLAAAGAVTMVGDRMAVVDGAAPADRSLWAGWDLLSQDKPRKPKSSIPRLSRDIGHRMVYGGLAEAGHVRHEERSVLGIFPLERWHPITARRAEAYQQVGGVLRGIRKPTIHTGGLVSLMHGFRIEHWAAPDLARREVRRRAKEIAESDWASSAASQAVRAAIQAAQAAAITAGAAAASAGAAASG